MKSSRGPRVGNKQRRPTQSHLSARRLAFDVLTAWHQRGAYAGRVLDDLSREHEVAGAERALAMELSYGVIRRQATIDAVLAGFVERPRKDIEDGLWTLLQIGVYQVLFLEGIPAHAAVHETVQVAKTVRRPAWTALLNGVLRTLCASVSEADASQMSVDQVPVDADHAKQLDRAVFSDPEASPIEYLVKAYSYPRWLVRDWVDRWGFEETTRLCVWFNAPSLVTIRVNPLRQSTDIVREVLNAAGVSTEQGEWPESLRLRNSSRISDLPGFAEGWFSVQDESAMAAARLLVPQPGEKVLDICAAPGGKTTHLAELMQDSGAILAVDTAEDRLSRIAENAKRLGLSCIRCQKISSDGDDLPTGPFDRVLIDVPCSNTGVLGKRPEVRWRIQPSDVVELSTLQRRLLLQALDRVKAGGCAVYSTCSIDPRENQDVVAGVIAQREDVKLIREIEHQPGRPCDGGYQALLQRVDR